MDHETAEYPIAHSYGVLAVRSYTSESAFDERDKELLTFVSQHIAAALLSKQAEEALKRSEAEARKLALVASRTDNAVIISDAAGVIEWVNDGFVRLTGYQPEEVVGRRPGAFLQGTDTDYGTVQRMKEALARNEGFHEEVLNYARDGRPYWVDIEVQPIRDEQGAVINYMAIERDITDRKRIEQERQKFVSLVENSSDLITMTSMQGEILYLNDAGRRLVGIQGSPSSARFRIEDFLDQENLPEHLPIYKATYDACLHFEQVVRSFSRYHKPVLSSEQRERIEGYSIGQDLRDGARRVLKLIVRANARGDKVSVLLQIREEVEELKVLLRLCHDAKGFPNFNSFEHAIALVVNVARQNEGWLKSQQQSYSSTTNRNSPKLLVETRNRKLLRPNPIASRELRVGALRVFYDVASTRAPAYTVQRQVVYYTDTFVRHAKPPADVGLHSYERTTERCRDPDSGMATERIEIGFVLMRRLHAAPTL